MGVCVRERERDLVIFHVDDRAFATQGDQELDLIENGRANVVVTVELDLFDRPDAVLVVLLADLHVRAMRMLHPVF